MIKSVSGTIGNERRKRKNKWKKKGEKDEEERDEEKGESQLQLLKVKERKSYKGLRLYSFKLHCDLLLMQ